MPAVRLLTEDVVGPLLHLYVYAVVPPLAVTDADPVFPPLQETCVPLQFADKAGG